MKWPKYDAFPSSVILSSLIWKSWQNGNSWCSLKCHHAGMRWHLVEDVWSCLWPLLDDFSAKLGKCLHATVALHSAKELLACSGLLLDTSTKVCFQNLSPESYLLSFISAWVDFSPWLLFHETATKKFYTKPCKIVCAFKKRLKLVVGCGKRKKIILERDLSLKSWWNIIGAVRGQKEQHIERKGID